MKRTTVLHPCHHNRVSPASVPEFRAEVFPRAEASTLRWADEGPVTERRQVICEREARIFVDGRQLVTLVCSGASFRELALGFLYSEGVIGSLEDVRGMRVDVEGLEAWFEIETEYQVPECPVVTSGFGGRALQTSSEAKHGGVCGGLRGVSELVPWALANVRAMCEGAVEYAATRGMHCSALFDGLGLVALFEDIGRHNTFDKLAGHCLLEGVDPAGMLLTTTGRVSSDMMRKALALGVCGVASCSGPTDTAVRLARENGALLVGYSTGSSPIVYAGPGFSEASESASRDMCRADAQAV